MILNKPEQIVSAQSHINVQVHCFDTALFITFVSFQLFQLIFLLLHLIAFLSTTTLTQLETHFNVAYSNPFSLSQTLQEN